MFTKLKNLFWRFEKEESGNFAIPFALMTGLIVFCGAASVEITSLHGGHSRSQDMADIAVLAAAKHIAVNIEEITSDTAFNKYKSEARKIGEDMLDNISGQYDFKSLNANFDFTTEQVTIELDVVQSAKMMGAFGYDEFPIHVKSTAVLPTSQPQDIDIVLITDATGSMATEISAVQDNMRNLPVDLANELDGAGISVGSIRVKFIFYRDYLFDNVPSVPSRFDAPPNATDGAMFESPFYELPDDTTAMETYVNQFSAYGGGDNPESGIEALVHAVDNVDWRPGSTTVRSVILWTDAETRNIHEFLPPDENLQDDWWFTNAEWITRISTEFAALDLSGRSQHMFDNYYPSAEIPATLEEIKVKFESFHAENSNDDSDIVSFTINVSETCTDATGLGVCGAWDQLASWAGVEVNHESAAMSSADTYWDTIRDIAEAARTQISARDLAISN